MKKIITLMILLGLFSAAEAQTGSIEGTVVTSDKQPAAFVNVWLKGTGKGMATDTTGAFQFSNVDAGSYTLITSYVGSKRQEMQITIRAGRHIVLPKIVLTIGAEELQEVVINGDKINKFHVDESEYVAKLPLEKLENPQVYNSISADLLKEQVVTSFDDALKNAPGITKLWESTGRGGDGAGYFSLRGFAVQPTMINGLPGLTNGGLDPANIERIEVIKGPSGTLYGSSLISYGGLINIVTKKPYNTFGGEIGYTAGSFGLNRITADINTPLSRENNVALRINTAYHTENSYQDAGFRKSLFVAPSLSYKVNDRLSFLINTEFYNAETTNPPMLFLDRGAALSVPTIDALNYNKKLSFTSNDLTIHTPAFNLQARMSYKLSDAWTSETVFSRSSAKSDGYYSYLYETSRFHSADVVFTRYISKQNATTLTTDLQQNFIGDFNIGNLRNRIIAGVDYFQRTAINNNSGYIGYGNVTPQQNYYDDPADPNDNTPVNLSRPAVDAALATAALTNSTTEEEILSAYVSNVLNFTPELSAMVSLRVDHFNNKGTYNANADTTTGDFSQTSLSPKFGVVYQPLKDRLSLFANYMNGFKNVSPQSLGDGSTQSFKPEQANQWEAGVKMNMLNGKVAATVSYYDITVSNVVRSPMPLSFIQDGQNYSKGMEASVVANPITGLNIIAGYSYNDSEIKTENEDLLGRRPEAAGPVHLANTWISYKFPGGVFSGWGIGFGGNYASENKILNRASTGVFALPEYVILNASVFYQVDAFEVALKLDNISNEIYYNGWSTINPQQPRNLSASLTYSF